MPTTLTKRETADTARTTGASPGRAGLGAGVLVGLAVVAVSIPMIAGSWPGPVVWLTLAAGFACAVAVGGRGRERTARASGALLGYLLVLGTAVAGAYLLVYLAFSAYD